MASTSRFSEVEEDKIAEITDSAVPAIVRSELILNIKRIRDWLVRVLLTNTRTGLPYNELEIFNTALSSDSRSIENISFIVR